MNEGQELVEAPKAEIQPFDKFEAEIVEFEKYNAEKQFDLTTEEGKEACEKYLFKLRKVEIAIDKTRKAKGTDLRKAVTDLNASAKVWTERVHKMYEVIDKPLRIIKQAELDAAIDKMEKEKAAEKAIEDKRLADLAEREEKAAAKEAELKAKEDAMNAEANKLAVAKQIEEAEKIGAANAVIIAEAKAEQDKIDAIAALQAEHHQQENDRLAKEITDKLAANTEKSRLAEIERKRQANVEHRKAFNNAAVLELDDITCNSKMSIDIVKAIVKGEIPNISMNY